jgi:hypothetical protein
MAKDNGRIVAKRVMPNVNIGAAHPAVADLKLHLVVTARGLWNVQNTDISLTGCILYDSLHSFLPVLQSQTQYPFRCIRASIAHPRFTHRWKSGRGVGSLRQLNISAKFLSELVS